MEFLAALSSANFAKAIALVDQQLAAGNEHTSNGSTPMPTCMMARLYMNRAFCKYRLQLYRKAVKEPFVEQGSRCTICGNSCLEQDYDQALQMQPGNMEALYLKGLVLEALKRPEVPALPSATIGFELIMSSLRDQKKFLNCQLFTAERQSLLEPASVLHTYPPCL
eukprot:scaffold12949_cov20-Tisochrysis_lutea.AAC.1